ncbi:hypothetical protein GF386_05220 [Candidatus Pacearchaeota archaeon]|nr:hypothetical protein [Candidatus Pacearchaeota archaeon]MBD3283510.1 hypothetical protein [Candidatus Pacearchaeota archaeon]
MGIDVRIEDERVLLSQSSNQVRTHKTNTPEFLIHCFLYFLQTEREVPHEQDWNDCFYQGRFGEKDIPPDMQTLKKITAEPGRVRLTQGSEESEFEDIFGICDRYKNILVYPRISEDRLVYVSEGEDEIFKIAPDCVECMTSRLTDLIIEDMQIKDRVGIIYSHFSFESYRQ